MMNKCILCGCAEWETLFEGVVKCQHCGHVAADLSMNEDQVHGLYNKSYFFGGEYADYIKEKKSLQKNFRLRMKGLKSFLDPVRHKRLIEIGCAYGYFLDIARSYFCNVQGIDITEEGIFHAREHLGLDVIHGDFLKHDFGNQKFDVVCLWDTIEHLHNPMLYLEKISRHVDRGSLLALTTGDIGSINARLRKEKWRLFHPPTHLHYFNKKTLGEILNHHGFEIVYHKYCGSYRSFENMAYNVLVLRGKGPVLYSLLHKARFTGFHIYLNLRDIMYVIARKR